jgi:hypothetical protein
MAVAILCALSTAALAIMIDSGDGSGNTSPPPDDPGWDHVGKRSNLCVVYLRNGWVLTAQHVATGDVILAGQIYTAVPGSEIQIQNPDSSLADLKVFAITPDPGLPDLPIRSSNNLPNGDVIMIGHGYNRGAASDSDDPLIWAGPDANPNPAIDGYFWGVGTAKRWGENVVTDDWSGDPRNTKAFYTTFDDPWWDDYLTHEAQATVGDSGGAVFAKVGQTWELAGIMYVIGSFPGQATGNALYGNITGAAKLSIYRDEIMTLTATPVPEPTTAMQLGICAALLAALHGRSNAARRAGRGPCA